MTDSTTIILADDHELVRVGLRDTLQRLEPDFHFLEAASLDEAMDLARRESTIALSILDLYMPGMDGADGIRRMKEVLPDAPVAVISGSVRDADIETCIAAGASGFIPKTMKILAMANAIRLILSGEVYLPYRSTGTGSGDTSAAAGLTPREREILGAIARGKSNKEIARDLGVEEVTVKLHATNLFRKLGVSNRTHAAMKGHELGLI